MSAAGSVEGLLCYIRIRKKALLLGETCYFDRNDIDWLCLHEISKGKRTMF